MAVVATQVSVTTAATLLLAGAGGVNSPSYNPDDYAAFSALLKNITGTAAVVLGDSGVTAATGFQWDVADGPLSIDLEPGESLYGIVASVNQVVHVLKEGR